MARMVFTLLAVLGVIAGFPSSARAALVTCPDVGDPERVFAIDDTGLGATVSCFDYGTGNNLTGGASDDFLHDPANDVTFFDYDNGDNQTDNFFSFDQLGNHPTMPGFVYGTFSIGDAYTSSNTELYLGFKVGNNLNPAWAVFLLSGFASGSTLDGTWFIEPVQGAGISHMALYGNADVPPPDVEPDPAVPEPASLLLLGSGLVGLAARARQRRRKQ